MNNTRPSFYLISSAVDGNVNSIDRMRHHVRDRVYDL